jgi:tetratricopeptide (TPR) repeat protein
MELSRMNLSLRWLVLSLCVAPFAMGSFCIGAPGKGPDELVQEQACIQNFRQKDYDAAQDRCNTCIEFNERNYHCLHGLGLIWYARGDNERAKKYYIMAVRENNDFAEGRNSIGVMAFDEGDFAEAVENFKKALEISPRYEDARRNLAMAHFRSGFKKLAKGLDPEPDYRQAEDHSRQLIQLFPNNTASYSILGTIMTYRASKELENEKRYRDLVGDAEQYFTRCLEIDPSFKDCRANLAHIYLAVGRFDDALFHYVQCLSTDKNDPICATEIQQAYKGSQLQSEALKKYMQQLVENPGYGRGHYGFCLALFEKGLVDMAVTECENAIKLDPTICLAHYQLAKHYKSVLNKDLAVQNCRQALSCSGDTKNESQVNDCKTIIKALEVE